MINIPTRSNLRFAWLAGGVMAVAACTLCLASESDAFAQNRTIPPPDELLGAARKYSLTLLAMTTEPVRLQKRVDKLKAQIDAAIQDRSPGGLVRRSDIGQAYVRAEQKLAELDGSLRLQRCAEDFGDMGHDLRTVGGRAAAGIPDAVVAKGRYKHPECGQPQPWEKHDFNVDPGDAAAAAQEGGDADVSQVSPDLGGDNGNSPAADINNDQSPSVQQGSGTDQAPTDSGNASGNTTPASNGVDNVPITAPTDEASLNAFVDKLKARYIGKQAGLITRELSSIAFAGEAQDVQDSSRYCQGWVKVATLDMKVAKLGTCEDGMAILRCEPGTRSGSATMTCYNLGGIKGTDLRFVTVNRQSKSTTPVYVDVMTYADFKAMAERYATDPANDPARWTYENEKALDERVKQLEAEKAAAANPNVGDNKPTPEQQAEIDQEVAGDIEDNQLATAQGQPPTAANSVGTDDLDGLRSDYAMAKNPKPTTESELGTIIGNLAIQLGGQVVDFSAGASPGLGGFYQKVSTEGIIPDTERCTATVSRILGDCRRSTNVLGCSGINIYAMNKRQKHTTTCYELWGVSDTKLHFVMAYSYWDAEDVVRYAGTLTVAAYRNLHRIQTEDQQQVGEGMKMLNDMLEGGDEARCALATNGTTGAKAPGCP